MQYIGAFSYTDVEFNLNYYTSENRLHFYGYRIHPKREDRSVTTRIKKQKTSSYGRRISEVSIYKRPGVHDSGHYKYSSLLEMTPNSLVHRFINGAPSQKA
jgi:hypothetical protein